MNQFQDGLVENSKHEIRSPDYLLRCYEADSNEHLTVAYDRNRKRAENDDEVVNTQL